MSDGNFQVEFTTDAKEDLRDLDGGSQKRVAAAIKNKLAVAPQGYGHPLGSRRGGDLTGFRKLAVGNRDLSIIYEVVNGDRVVIWWVIGNRSDDECYSLT
ncbi:type II toxin-antitoxin system RelE/ParE family toxin [Corynebacterium sp. P5848]|uniref:type II toxin-antitoxin system RelE family toxin n=1 Tax=Corynebacterium marambiense TaxID=2765364 RepID=UPI002260EAB7|nr:type II toxin-antitoxin system RelE/ParE family toxin [Corynebacterium marambiense]MCX7543334.1 type II toxin-antitoxin system RelE/ParE family toxin [Corynebacterium marambiense]